VNESTVRSLKKQYLKLSKEIDSGSASDDVDSGSVSDDVDSGSTSDDVDSGSFFRHFCILRIR
jgi:hypothetical protein